MKLFTTAIFLLFLCFSVQQTNAQLSFKNQRPKLEIGVDFRYQWFLLFPFFPTAHLSVGLNNGKSSLSLSAYTSVLSPDYLGTGLKYSRYKYFSEHFFIGGDAECSFMVGRFPYNEYENSDLYANNRYCTAASLSLNLGYQANSKNIISVFGGLGGVYSFGETESSNYNTRRYTKKYEDKPASMLYQIGLTYKRLITI